MRGLIDTHTLLWWGLNDPRLPAHIRQIIEDRGNQLHFSAASGWEIATKVQIGKLHLTDTPENFVREQMTLNSIEELPISLRHTLHVYTLPMHHRDPFDRILVAQSQLEGMPIITSDPLIALYAVTVIW